MRPQEKISEQKKKIKKVIADKNSMLDSGGQSLSTRILDDGVHARLVSAC